MRSQILRTIICAGLCLFAAGSVSTDASASQSEVYVLDNAYTNSVRIEIRPESETEGMMYYLYNDTMTYENTSGMHYICLDDQLYVKQTESGSAHETDPSEEAVTEDELSGEAVTEADTEEETLLNDLEEDVPDGYIYWGVKTDQYLLNMPAETLGGSTGSAEGDNSWFDMYTECYVSSGFAAGNTLYTVTWYHPDGTFEQVNLLQGRSGSGTYKLTSNFLILRENNGSDKDHLNEYHYYVKDGIIYQTVYLKQSNTNMP